MSRRAPPLLLALLAAAPLAARAAPPRPPTPRPGAPGDTVAVKREGARLMRGPRFFGSACAGAVVPGQQVKVLERQRGWARIAAPGAGKCWLHESSWADREAGALAGAPGAGASQRDIELAARGFSEGEEARFRGEHAELGRAFEAIDAHLARAAEPGADELTRFAADGGLGGTR